MTASVVLGDAFALLAAMREGCVDHVITDLPYDARTHRGQRSCGADGSLIDFAPLTADDLRAFVREALRVSRRWVVAFCAMEQLGAYQAAAGPCWIRSGFWRKPDGAPQFTGDRPGQPGEALAILHGEGRKRWNGGGKHAFWACGMERNDRVHPTQKPLALMRQLVEDFTDEGALVLDPFCGSASTGVACVQLGRRFVGIEKRRDYATVARDRLAVARFIPSDLREGLSARDYRDGQTSLLGLMGTGS